MKVSFLILLVCICTIICAQNNRYDTLIVKGTKRSYITYVPACYTPGKLTPVVFCFHGRGSTNQSFESHADFRNISDTADFIIVIPQGLNYNSKTGWDNIQSVDSASNDILFVTDIINALRGKYTVDSDRVYACGLSNGGFMSYDLACFITDKFAAIASVSGGMDPSHACVCKPTHSIPVMEIHGTSDNIVTYDGARGLVNSVPIDSLVKFWVNFNNCNPTPFVYNVPAANSYGRSTVVHFTFPEKNGVCCPVELYKIFDGGHSWPGTTFPSEHGNTNQDINASVEIWRFFSRFSRRNELSKKLDKQYSK